MEKKKIPWDIKGAEKSMQLDMALEKLKRIAEKNPNTPVVGVKDKGFFEISVVAFDELNRAVVGRGTNIGITLTNEMVLQELVDAGIVKNRFELNFLNEIGLAGELYNRLTKNFKKQEK